MRVKRRTLRAAARDATRRVEILGERAAAASERPDSRRDEAFLALYRARVKAYAASLRYLEEVERCARGSGKEEASRAVGLVKRRLAELRDILAAVQTFAEDRRRRQEAPPAPAFTPAS